MKRNMLCFLAVALAAASALAEIIASAEAPAIKYDYSHAKCDITESGGDTVAYSTAWAEGAAKVRLYRASTLLAELTGEGEYTFSYDDSQYGAFPIKLVSVDGNGNAIAEEKHIYIRYRDVQVPQLPSAVTIVSSTVRESDPTIIDTVYRVTSEAATCDTRILAFEDGTRSFAKILRPTTLVEGTEANVGDGVPANRDLTVSWRVSADWSVNLAKVKVEILVKRDRLLPLGFFRIRDPSTAKEYLIAKNTPNSTQVFDALLWLYADKTAGLSVVNGCLMDGETGLVNGESVQNAAAATQYCIRRMDCEPLPASGAVRDLVNGALRTTLNPSGYNQWAYKELQ